SLDSIAARMSRSERTLIAPNLGGRGLRRSLVERVDLALERLEVLEALVDAGKPDVGDVVEAPELRHRELADLLRRDLGHALGAELGLDLVGSLLGGAVRHGPARQGLAKAADELVAVPLLSR